MQEPMSVTRPTVLDALKALIVSLTDEGGLLRVRSVLALGFTGIGGAQLLLHQTMPPDAFNVMWTGVVAYYYGTRGAR